jgi:hypothetical protein
MLSETDNYFIRKDEPVRECLLFLRTYILGLDVNITEAWKYGMPFYCYKNKMFCYLWTDKKDLWPYLGIVEGNKVKHPALVQEKRARMKILRIDPEKDIPLKMIDDILHEVLALYRENQE